MFLQGRYYILAELPGYMSPLTEFTSEDITFLNNKDEKQLQALLDQVTVANGQTTRMDFRLERGAAIGGTVLYDDGSAVVGSQISLLRKQKDGSWRTTSTDRFGSEAITDDRGHYRIAMLPVGEYLVAVGLRRNSMISTNRPLPTLSTFTDPNATRIYFGDTATKSEAKSISVHMGEEHSGADITVPLSKLFVVSGTVVAKSDGHIINYGTIRLADPLDGTILKETGIYKERFTIELVPEGQYILKVSSAADGVMETVQVGSTNATYSRLKTVHAYSDGEQPLIVHGDVAGITLTVADQDSGANARRGKASELNSNGPE